MLSWLILRTISSRVVLALDEVLQLTIEVLIAGFQFIEGLEAFRVNAADLLELAAEFFDLILDFPSPPGKIGLGQFRLSRGVRVGQIRGVFGEIRRGLLLEGGIQFILRMQRTFPGGHGQMQVQLVFVTDAFDEVLHELANFTGSQLIS